MDRQFPRLLRSLSGLVILLMLTVGCTARPPADERVIESEIQTRVAAEFDRATREAETERALRSTIEAEVAATASMAAFSSNPATPPTPDGTATRQAESSMVAQQVQATMTAANQAATAAAASASTMLPTPTPAPTIPPPGMPELEPELEIGFTPVGIPIRISANSNGEINFGISQQWVTPIGVFDLGGSLTVLDVEAVVRQEGAATDRHLLFVRVDNDVRVFEIQERQQFFVEFDDHTTLYRKVALEHRSNGDVVLELESQGASAPSDGAQSCATAADPAFVSLWQPYRDLLGCAVTARSAIGTIAEEEFEGGHLFWRRDTNEVYAVYDRVRSGGDRYEGFWESDPEWDWGEAGEPDPDGIGLVPPPGRVEPKRGFGWLWRTYLGRENGLLGWALDREYGWDNVASVQYFNDGIMFQASDPRIYILLYDGRFFASR